MAKTITYNWCSEEEAMELLGYKRSSLRILTRNEKSKTLPIRTTKPNYRKILYSKTDIENFLNDRATA
jgi:hypothetical protein